MHTRTSVAEIADPTPRSIAIGPFGSSLKADMYELSGIPVVRGQNIGESPQIDEHDLVFVSQETADRFPACMLSEGDLVFPHRGAIGRVGIVGKQPMLLSSSMMKLRCDRSKVDPLFMLYYFRGPGKNQLLMRASTVGTPGIGQPLASLRGIPLEIPSLPQQEAIAEVLGALDDKITANNELATAADDLARALFRQALKSATYSDESFADLAEVSGGGTPSTKKPEYWDGTIPWATPTDVTSLSGPYLEETSRTISEMGLKYCSSALYPAGSILMTSRATIGAFALAQVPTAVNQGFIVVQPNDPSLRFWLFHEMRSRVDEFISLANGATFLELSRGNFKKFKVRKATPETMAAFNETAETLHDSARAALLENNSLAATRDALLPQLMSGKIRVREAESIVEDVL